MAVSGFRLRARLGFSIPASSLRPARHYPRLWIWRPSPGRQWDFNPPDLGAAQHTLRPRLTSHAVSPRRPFSHKVRSPQVRTRSFPAQPPDLRRLSLDHESFAVCRPLALLGNASYPVLVHRLAVSLHASSPRSVALTQLRFASFAVVNSREDFHLQDRAHAGRTTGTPAQGRGRGAALAGRILRR